MPKSADWLIAVVFADIALMLLLSLALAGVARRLRQPAVIGEIVAGIALGPSLLGLLHSDLPRLLFPPEARSHLAVLAQLGLVLFMFGVGYELDTARLRQQGRVATLVSTVSIVLPFTLGVGTALILHPHFGVADGEPVSLTALALFLGAAMSITAFPVLARILAQRGLLRHPLGMLSLGCAAVNDFLAWCMLAVVVAVVSAGGDSATLVTTLAGSAAFVLVVGLLLRPALRRLAGSAWAARQSRAMLVVLTVVGVLVCSAISAQVGLHPVFGAFAFGVVLPRVRVEQVAPALGATIEQLGLVLLPVFFIVTGLGVDFAALGTVGVVAVLLVVPVAIVGKFAGAAGAARLAGLGTRQAAAVGLLMNTRGLTELIILTVGRQLGVLDTRLFTVMVIMALVTTVMAGPLLDVVYPLWLQEADDVPAPAARAGAAGEPA